MSHTSPSVSAAALSCTPSSHPSNPSHEIAGVNAISLEIRWCTDVRKSARTFSPARLRETCQVEAGLRYRALPRLLSAHPDIRFLPDEALIDIGGRSLT